MLVNIFLTKNQQRNCNLIIFDSVRLEAFSKFKDTKDALAATSSLIEGKLPKKLKKFLEKNIISKEV
jgi:hypothetical protein